MPCRLPPPPLPRALGRPKPFPASCPVLPTPSFPSPPLLLGVEIAFQLPFAFPINPDSAIKPAGGAGREAAAGTGPLGAVASAPLPFRPRLLPAPPCAAGRPGREREPLELLLPPWDARRAQGRGSRAAGRAAGGGAGRGVGGRPRGQLRPLPTPSRRCSHARLPANELITPPPPREAPRTELGQGRAFLLVTPGPLPRGGSASMRESVLPVCRGD